MCDRVKGPGVSHGKKGPGVWQCKRAQYVAG